MDRGDGRWISGGGIAFPSLQEVFADADSLKAIRSDRVAAGFDARQFVEPVAYVHERHDLGTFNGHAGQSSCGKSSGIDVDPVEPDVRLKNRCVAVDNDLLEFLVPKQKVVTNP